MPNKVLTNFSLNKTKRKNRFNKKYHLKVASSFYFSVGYNKAVIREKNYGSFSSTTNYFEYFNCANKFLD